MKSLPAILATVVIVLLLIGAYVGAYLGMGTEYVTVMGSRPGAETIGRVYTQQWLCTAFKPAAWAESKIRGTVVEVCFVSPELMQEIPPTIGRFFSRF